MIVTICLPYVKRCTYTMGRKPRKHNIKVIYNAPEKLFTKLPSSKDCTSSFQNPGIYKIFGTCGKDRMRRPHMSNLGLIEETVCGFCQTEKKTAVYVLRDSTALMGIRLSEMDSEYPKAEI
ncbi:hypothetical protein Trydic_g17124 [Trypoxylus dichotomus]